jgi:purine-nucleoside/S-methyl-5'-thioadenosine phosphorylase / adenosine deaminase
MTRDVAQHDDAAAARSELAARLQRAQLDWIVPQWPAPACVHALVTTRRGGVSTGAQASLDLGTRVPAGDDAARDAVLENRRRVQQFLPAAPRWLDQVHGADVVVLHASDDDTAAWPRADAAVTRDAGVVLAVRIADCLPVLFSNRTASVIGVAHAGWRGLAAGVLEHTVAALRCAPADVVAWLGPAIGPAAFEVGDDVRDAFVGDEPAAVTAFAAGRPGKWHADLPALARRRLAQAGVTDVTASGLCTASDPARFFSYRRDGATGRMAAFVWRRRA